MTNYAPGLRTIGDRLLLGALDSEFLASRLRMQDACSFYAPPSRYLARSCNQETLPPSPPRYFVGEPPPKVAEFRVDIWLKSLKVRFLGGRTLAKYELSRFIQRL